MNITIDISEPAELEHLMGWLHENNLLDRVELNQITIHLLPRAIKRLILMGCEVFGKIIHVL